MEMIQHRAITSGHYIHTTGIRIRRTRQEERSVKQLLKKTVPSRIVDPESNKSNIQRLFQVIPNLSGKFTLCFFLRFSTFTFLTCKNVTKESYGQRKSVSMY